MVRGKVSFKVNGRCREITIEVNRTLLEVIQDETGLIGIKEGCGTGDCTCAVSFEDLPVNVCLVPAVEADGKIITTIQGVSQHGSPDPLQKSFVVRRAIRCGFSTPQSNWPGRARRTLTKEGRMGRGHVTFLRGGSRLGSL